MSRRILATIRGAARLPEDMLKANFGCTWMPCRDGSWELTDGPAADEDETAVARRAGEALNDHLADAMSALPTDDEATAAQAITDQENADAVRRAIANLHAAIRSAIEGGLVIEMWPPSSGDIWTWTPMTSLSIDIIRKL